MSLEEISKRLSRRLAKLGFAEPVTHVYDPLRYAWSAHSQYLERFGKKRNRVVLLGMNPGPWGMAQTGVPFGEVNLVRDWMGIDVPVDRPANEHPKRPIEGFACPRSEVSGRRLWSWAKERFGTAEAFFERFFVLNHCPLCFMEASGRNRTPDKLPKAERVPLLDACDAALRQTIELLSPRYVIGVGGFAKKRAEKALAGLDVTIATILHPSPASPKANRGWAEQAEKELADIGIELP